MVTNNSWNSEDPAQVSKGGTGVDSTTAYAVQCGGTTSTAPLQSIAGVGSSGEVLTSNGAGALPTFQATGDVSGPVSSTDNALARWDGTAGDTLQDSSVIVTDDGEMTNASQPAFLAYLATTDSNVTGNAGTYTLGSGNALTEVYDQNGDFVTSGTFTAPVTGRYLLGVKFSIIGLTNTEQNNVEVITSNRTYLMSESWTARSNTSVAATLSIIADMDATDTATFDITIVGNGSNDGDAIGSTSLRNAVWGSLIC